MRSFWLDIFRLFFPETCAVCGSPLPEGAHLVCTRCRWEMPLTGYAADRDNPVARKFWGLIPVESASAYLYFIGGSGYRRAIHDFKYRGAWRLCVELGRWQGADLRASGLYADVDVVVPVPLHPRKQLRRGYNQAGYLAEGIASELGLPVDRRSVARTVYNRSQATRSRNERWDNVEGIFSLRRRHGLTGKHVLLVDDVLTTGATIASCAEAILHDAPGSRISIATLAVSAREMERVK
ncbi:MAG: ComF family protein [Rikenellaceae bacterium]|nr:ComF family protein [Rikenellaceae bacterium]